MNVLRYLRPTLFFLGGAALGLVYYLYFGCRTGACLITSSPVVTMVYVGILGWLLSGLFEKGCK